MKSFAKKAWAIFVLIWEETVILGISHQRLLFFLYSKQKWSQKESNLSLETGTLLLSNRNYGFNLRPGEKVGDKDPSNWALELEKVEP